MEKAAGPWSTSEAGGPAGQDRRRSYSATEARLRCRGRRRTGVAQDGSKSRQGDGLRRHVDGGDVRIRPSAAGSVSLRCRTKLASGGSGWSSCSGELLLGMEEKKTWGGASDGGRQRELLGRRCPWRAFCVGRDREPCVRDRKRNARKEEGEARARGCSWSAGGGAGREDGPGRSEASGSRGEKLAARETRIRAVEVVGVKTRRGGRAL